MKRFDEDGLRILRALRFASRYGFDIDKETSDAIHRQKFLLSFISAERINSELCGILTGDCYDISVITAMLSARLFPRCIRA